MTDERATQARSSDNPRSNDDNNERDGLDKGRGHDAPDEHDEDYGILHIIGSILSAGLGVQSSKNRERDFKRGRMGVFIAAGLIFTLLFIATLVTIVSLVVGAD